MFLGIGAVGAVLPVLPTTPFLLLASFFFVRSSPRLNEWLLRSPSFGPLLRDWRDHRGVRPRVKFVAAAMVLATIVISIGWGELWWPLLVLLLALAAVGLTVVLLLPTVRETPGAKASAAGESDLDASPGNDPSE
jgi:uncharacterized membrane protein YbaN (DUF454 family)